MLPLQKCTHLLFLDTHQVGEVVNGRLPNHESLFQDQGKTKIPLHLFASDNNLPAWFGEEAKVEGIKYQQIAHCSFTAVIEMVFVAPLRKRHIHE